MCIWQLLDHHVSVWKCGEIVAAVDIFIPYNVSSVYRGCSVHRRDILSRSGYIQYIRGCSVKWRNKMSAGNIIGILEDVQYIAGYYDSCRGTS